MIPANSLAVRPASLKKETALPYPIPYQVMFLQTRMALPKFHPGIAINISVGLIFNKQMLETES
jgi:hypothetical protein